MAVMSAFTSNGWDQASSVAGPSFLHARHAPPSSFGGSMASSRLGTSVISRDDMLNRLVLDQASVDCQDYGIMDLEEVAEAKRELKHISRKLVGLRTKLKVETKIRDAAVALRKAHRKTAHDSGSLPPPSPTSTLDHSSLSPSSQPSRHRALSISSNEAKAEHDVALATAKVDRVVHELFKITERASELRRSILEHQAATLSQRVTHLEFDRQMMDAKQLPYLTSSSSFDSLAPSASVSAVGVLSPVYAEDARAAADMTLRQPHIERDRAFKFPDTSVKLRQHTEELGQSADMIKGLQAELVAVQREAQQRQTTADQLSRQLEQEKQARARVEQDLRTSLQRSTASDEHQKRADVAEKALKETKTQAMAHERALSDHRTRLAEAERKAQSLAQRTEAAEKALADRNREAKDLETSSLKQLSLESQGHVTKIETLLRDLDVAKSSQRTAEALADDRQSEMERQRQNALSLQSRLDAQSSVRSGLESRLAESQHQTEAAKTTATQAQSKLRELELAVGAERKIMAERDELFHAFERRLESAEMRLQEQDKRCARMLGKLDGREEMDDLLERIKAGAAGVAKKQKTAGQDIAALLSSLETHISDLELELARATYSAVPDQEPSSPESRPMQPDHARLELSTKEEELHALRTDLGEAQRKFKTELEKALTEQHAKVEKARNEERAKADRLLAEEREKSEQRLAQERNRLEQTLAQEREKMATTASAPASRSGPSEENAAKLRRLEAEVDNLTKRNNSLEDQLRSSSPLTTGTNLRAMNTLGRGAPTNKGVGNLIDKFGGGRKLGPDNRSEDHTPAIQACIKTVEGLRSMLPDLSAAAAGSADLQAIRTAFHAATPSAKSPLSPTKKSNRPPAMLDAGDMQVELDSIAARMKGILEISRAVIELALRGDADSRKTSDAETNLRFEHSASIADMKVRLASLTTKLHAQKDKEKKLMQTLAETKQELSEAKQLQSKAECVPMSPTGLEPEAGSTLGLAMTAGKGFSSLSRATSQSHLAIRTPSNGSSPAHSLAPPRSPMDPIPSPTRSNYGALASPSIRYISPYAPPGPDSRSLSGKIAGSASLVEASDSHSIPSSSPSSVTLGMPSPATSILGLSRLQYDQPPMPAGAVKRTITLGMDVPQLVARVRELERLLSQTASMRQKADKVPELEAQLREANQTYAALVHRMEEERSTDTRQKVGLLNELNDAHNQLQTTKAHIQRVAQHSPAPRTPSPLPPPKD